MPKLQYLGLCPHWNMTKYLLPPLLVSKQQNCGSKTTSDDEWDRHIPVTLLGSLWLDAIGPAMFSPQFGPIWTQSQLQMFWKNGAWDRSSAAASEKLWTASPEIKADLCSVYFFLKCVFCLDACLLLCQCSWIGILFSSRSICSCLC